MSFFHLGVPACLCIALFASLSVSQQSLLYPLSHLHPLPLTLHLFFLPLIPSKQSFLKTPFMLSPLSLSAHFPHSLKPVLIPSLSLPPPTTPTPYLCHILFSAPGHDSSPITVVSPLHLSDSFTLIIPISPGRLAFFNSSSFSPFPSACIFVSLALPLSRFPYKLLLSFFFITSHQIPIYVRATKTLAPISQLY